MVRRGKIRCYSFRHLYDEEIAGIYFPEQLMVDEDAPNFFGVHYVHPELSLSPKAKSLREIHPPLEKFLLELDELLPEEPLTLGDFEVIPEDLEPPDIWWAPHPKDYERLKAGKRKRITELPEWQIYFTAPQNGK